jgi:hypothetical protein
MADYSQIVDQVQFGSVVLAVLAVFSAGAVLCIAWFGARWRRLPIVE